MSIDDQLHGLSTIITTEEQDGSGQGSGFFFSEIGERDRTQDPQWVSLKNVWLVTNRHVVLPDDSVPNSLTFRTRKIVGGSQVWHEITLDKQSLMNRILVHVDPNVDICIVSVLDLLQSSLQNNTDGVIYLPWQSVSNDNYGGMNKIHPHAGSDAVVLGYPHGFYDEHNLFPVIKSGIIASRWGAKFNDQPYFLVDAKLFPGSSGSIVISKPTDIAVENGQLFQSKNKHFAFLGIFSGEPFTSARMEGYNVGIVWYANLIDEIIANGVAVAEAVSDDVAK